MKIHSMKNAIVIILFFCAKVTFSQQNIYDSLAHKFFDLNAKEELTYRIVKNDLDRLIVSSKKNYYGHKIQEINLITDFLENLITLSDTNRLGNYQSIFIGFDTYSDSLFEQQISESQKNRILYDFENIDYCMWNKFTDHPLNAKLFTKSSKGGCGPSIFLTISINDQRFWLLNYEVKNKLTNEIFVCKGNVFSHCSLVSLLLENEENLDDYILINFIISDEIGNIFKVEKEFPLFKDYYND